jgi:hypothetical protein
VSRTRQRSGVNELTVSLASECAGQGVEASGDINARLCRIPRGPTTGATEQDEAGYQEIVDRRTVRVEG